MHQTNALKIESVEHVISAKVLVVDDDEINRMQLESMLSDQGYSVLLADNGKSAIDIFTTEQPDFVLMDVMMHVMDGYEATRRIKRIAGERFVPVIFLTAITNEEELAKCVKSGGDDFLSKPFSQVILMAKMEALERMRELYSVVMTQRDILEQNQVHLHKEQEAAKKVFTRMINQGCLDSKNIKYLISPLSLFNGDILLAARTPSGGMNVMLGDATGHGLPAAIGALPVSEIFYAMSSNGCAVDEIVIEINQKLHGVLPPEYFVCACVINLSNDFRTMTIWNGGLPDTIVYSGARHEISQRIRSSGFPLGIVDNSKFDGNAQIIPLEKNDRIYLYSDGITEARNAHDDLFGEKRLLECFALKTDPDNMFENILEAVRNYRGNKEQSDDVTLMEVTADITLQKNMNDICASTDNPNTPMDWQVSFDLSPSEIRSINPTALITRVLMDIQGLSKYRENIFLIISELYNNALDHGVLGLDSELKNNSNGFSEYIIQRQDRIDNLSDGWIKINLKHMKHGKEGGTLIFQFEDSGPGFDYQATNNQLGKNTGYKGRGISLVGSLCRKLHYREPGNCVEAVYDWL